MGALPKGPARHPPKAPPDPPIHGGLSPGPPFGLLPRLPSGLLPGLPTGSPRFSQGFLRAAPKALFQLIKHFLDGITYPR